MKRLVIFAILIFFLCLSVEGQDSLDWDIDSIFDEPLPELPVEDTTPTVTVQELIRRTGYTFEVYYRFAGGYNYGWHEVPWHYSPSYGDVQFKIDDYYSEFVVKMFSNISIDAQISNVFRARTTIYFEIPSFAFTLGDFFFDYSISNVVFIRGGKYGLGWGVSPNYNFTNLLARVPATGYNGDSYIIKADVPIGIGGLQVLAQTRENLLGGVVPKSDDAGYGAKYNLALRRADLNLGVFYQDSMPFRSFLSAKTTIMGTDLYNEWLLAVDTKEDNDTSFAVNFGLSRDFFSGKLSLNAELFFNGEGNAYWYRPETWYRKSEISPFLEGFNAAVNLLYRFDFKGNPRLFLQMRYSFIEESAFLVPGFIISPLPNLNFQLTVPMAMRNREGYYYSNTGVTDDIGRPLPFSIILLLSFSGGVSYGHYN